MAVQASLDDARIVKDQQVPLAQQAGQVGELAVEVFLALRLFAELVDGREVDLAQALDLLRRLGIRHDREEQTVGDAGSRAANPGMTSQQAIDTHLLPEPHHLRPMGMPHVRDLHDHPLSAIPHRVRAIDQYEVLGQVVEAPPVDKRG